jgi:hypothetical protein
MQLAAANADGKTSSTAGSKAKRLHQTHLRLLLVVLAEAGERPF